MTHQTIRIALFSIILMTLCSACGQIGGEGKELEGYWIGDAKSEITSDGDVERENINYAVVEIVAVDGALLVSFENFLNYGFPCIVEAEPSGDGRFDIDRTSCFSSDMQELEVSGSGNLSGEYDLSIELDLKEKTKYGIEFVDEGTVEFDLERF